MKYYAIGCSLHSNDDEYDDRLVSRKLFKSNDKARELIKYLNQVYGRYDWCWDLEHSVDAFLKGVGVEEEAHYVALNDFGTDEEDWEELYENQSGPLNECWFFLMLFDKIVDNSLMETE